MSKVAILGTGSWACALGFVLLSNGNEVLFWGRNEQQVELINKKKSYHLKELQFTGNLSATTDLEAFASFSDEILIALPSHAILEVLTKLSAFIDTPKGFINATKGLEPKSLMRVSEVVYETIDIDFINWFVLLTGPSHAEEVIKKDFTVVTAVSHDIEAAIKVQKRFANDYFRVYTNNDLKGGELCGAMKNAMAIGAGMLDGQGCGDNTKAAFIIRSVNEMMKLGDKMGVEKSTLIGLAGMGDAIVTCISKHSRNRNAGELIGKGVPIEEAISAQGMVVEGIPSIRSIYRLSKEYCVTMPIIEELYSVVYKGKNFEHAIMDLMSRTLKAE
jgi:glycerol-3-phosphate dehydrogenase (NAD(P)+)